MNAFRVAVLIASLIVVNGKVNFDSKTEKKKEKKIEKIFTIFFSFY